MVFSWPDVLKARSLDPHPRNGFRSGGRSLSGIEQRVVSDAGYWAVTVTGIRIRNGDEARAYRAMIARLRDGEAVIVPIGDAYRPVGARANGASVVFAADAALRATQLSLTVTGAELRAGHYLSIGGERLHLVKEVISAPAQPPFINQLVKDSLWDDRIPWRDAVSASAAYAVKVSPPLRAAAPAGTEVSLGELRLRCVIQDPADGDLELDLGRLGSPSLNLVEDF